MSFSDEDKEALDEDLDEIKSYLNLIEQRTNSIRREARTIVTMAWVFIIFSAILDVVLILGFVLNG